MNSLLFKLDKLLQLEYIAFDLYLRAGVVASELNYTKLSYSLNQQSQIRGTCFYRIYDFLRGKIPLTIFSDFQNVYFKDLSCFYTIIDNNLNLRLHNLNILLSDTSKSGDDHITLILLKNHAETLKEQVLIKSICTHRAFTVMK
ncbi:hypothetical protein APX81_25780 [Escherichia coli]|uniref:hypothetical protein n=1 Tax=Escherichia coli TaxID=562 RepID=UPI000589D5EF|nr:hypothetical protein [Escherichia coli]EAC1404443.1 hypothetical protein [Escherichia coli]KIH17228.1 hypothetical protein PU13_24790 [Escherichia coli]PAZ27604.1 hypothetical protein APU34_28280 [Escherichia coli]PAZ35760.1 hypothetical protein APU36_23340 [Escherichia coli]PAZ43464.1 hypothetical protein APX81_25780 [Escherichia coli]